MDLGVANRVALVAGSTRGIGRAIAERFLAEGALVAITGRSEGALAAATRELEGIAGPDRVAAYQADMTAAADIARVLSAISAQWKRLDIAVANVGNGSGKGAFESSAEDWDAALKTNLVAGVELARAVVPVMQSSKAGALLFISSIVAEEATTAPWPYSAAKTALVAFAKNLSRTVAGSGVRVNVLSPGNILFPGGSWAGRLDQDRDRVLAYIDREVPSRRFGTPQEIADVAVFMCSDRAGFMSGAHLVVDGGQTRGY